MLYLSREQIIQELQQSFHTYTEKYGIDDIGIFEEQGPSDLYYIGYTVNKNGETYHIHIPYMKNETGELTPINSEWTVESDDPRRQDLHRFDNLESVFEEIT